MRSWEQTACGPVRAYNEDDAASERWPGGGVVVVADGVGANSATNAATIVVGAVCAYYRELPPIARLMQGSAKQSIEIARDSLREQGELMGGCTVVMLVVHGEQALLGWAGDCRAYRQRGRTLSLLTKDHTLIERMIDEGQISAAEAASHPHRNILLRTIGAQYTDPEYSLELDELDVEPGDRYLLATDGAWRPLELWTLQRHMMADEDLLPELPAAIIAAAHAEDGGDNAAVAVVSCSEEAP